MSTLRSVRAVSPRRGGMARERTVAGLPCARTFSDSVSPEIFTRNCHHGQPMRSPQYVSRLLSAATARGSRARGSAAHGVGASAIFTKENS